MKKIFRLVSMLAVAGLTFSYTSCTDYSEDIDKANDRIDGVQTEIEGKIAKVNEQITGINTTIDELKAADKATNDAIESLKAQDAALQTAIDNLKKAHEADVKALTDKYDALKKSVDGNTAKIGELTTQFTNKLNDLEKAYKEADGKLQDQITVNKQSIATLQADVKKINEETIPALNGRIDELKVYADGKFATKDELTAQATKTAEEIKAVNELIGGLTSRLDGVDTRLTSLSEELKTLAEKYEAFVKSYASDKETFEKQIKALQDKDTELAGLIATAQAAAEAAQKTADEAVAAAKKAQDTADKAVEDAKVAKTAADNAQKDATQALTEIKAIQDVLEGYTEKGAIKAKFEELVGADLAAAARLDNLDDSIADITAKIKRLFADDAEMAENIATLFEQKFNKAEFSDEFKKAYEARFQNDLNAAFDSAWVSKFQPALDEALDKAWDDKFDAKFGDAFKGALETAVKSGIVHTAIETAKGDITAAQKLITDALGVRIDNLTTYVDEADSELDGKIITLTNQYNTLKTEVTELRTTLNQEILNYYGKAMDAFYQNLRSLVFIPELYVGGIESVEYIYASYPALYPPVVDGDPEYVELLWGDEADNKCLISTENWYTYEPMRDGDYVVSSYINPLVAVSYQMNPSSAVINKAADKFAFDVRDVESVRSSIAFDGDKPEAKVLSSENGILKVGINALGQIANQNRWNDGNDWWTENISIFALQAYVKTKEGKDTVVTSDYARLYANEMRFEELAFDENSDAVSEVECKLGYKLYKEAAHAIFSAPSLRVKYDGQLDLHDVVRTHIAVISPTKKNGTEHAVYEDKFPENDYNVEYKFQLIDYKVGVNETSQSQHAYLSGEDNCIFKPCGVDINGNRDESKTADLTSVGRRPLVRVTLVDKATDQVILVGFIKIEIVREKAPVFAEKFTRTFGYACDNGDGETFTWAEVVNNVLRKTNLTREEFAKLYELDKNYAGVAYQYGYVDGKLTDDVEPLGEVTEILDLEGRPFGSTTDVLNWKLDSRDMDRIYKSENNTATTYVRFVLKGSSEAHSSIYEGIYVPLEATVTKIQGDGVGEKIAQYWFNLNGKSTAKINVRVPKDKASDDNTLNWETNINQVWKGNAPVFGETIDKLIADKKASYKYYFAPVQPKYEIDGKSYRLYVKNDFVQDLYEKDAEGNPKKYKVTNESLYKAELANSLDIREGVYVNYTLFCEVTNIEDGKVESNVRIADFVDVDKYPHSVVKYYDDNDVAKKLLNAYPSDKPELLANIGVAVYLTPCYVALSVKDAVNPYCFLRPINVTTKNGEFTDAKDKFVKESNIYVIDLITLTDWRNENVVTNKYVKFYGVKGVKVDVDNATTNLGNEDSKDMTAKLSDVTDLIKLKYCSGSDWKKQNEVEGNYSKFTPVAGWDAAGLKPSLGFIHYENNGNNVQDFKIRVQVEVEYDWGWISNNYVDITVKKTTGTK